MKNYLFLPALLCFVLWTFPRIIIAAQDPQRHFDHSHQPKKDKLSLEGFLPLQSKEKPQVEKKIAPKTSPLPPKAKKSKPQPYVLPPDLSELNTTIYDRRTEDASLLCATNWQEKYAAMHARAANILHSVPSEEWDLSYLRKEGLRVFIYIAREGYWEGLKSGGVADRFSLVGLFALALAHNTAFFIDYPGLDEVFDSGSGGLSWSVNATGYIEKHGYKNTVLHFPDLYPKKVGGRVKCPLGNYGHKCRDLRIDDHMANNTLSIARTARGRITLMFHPQEVYYQPKLSALGLKHETAFGCLFDYLFQPSALLRRHFSQDIEAFDDSNTIKILLQIRNGNLAATNQNDPVYFETQILPHITSFLNCTLIMEAKIKSDENNRNKNILWYVMTDSSDTREYIKRKFGDKVFTHNSTIQNMALETYSKQSFLEVLGEQWCGGLADYFVVSKLSGLGRQSAFRSKRIKNRLVALEVDKEVQCKVVTDLITFGSQFSQI